MAANSVSTTIFQYLKVITVGEASASSVLIGTIVGSDGKNLKKIKEYCKSLQAIYLIVGCLLGIILFSLRKPFLSFYDLTPNAYLLSNQILIILCFIFVGMAYQMPAGVGIIKGGGDVTYVLWLNIISTWAIVIPLSFLGAFIWNLPVAAVVALLNSDQIFKCLPTARRVNQYQWIRKLTN
ncbi:transporter MATE [Anaerostipes sp. MSJ-23]|nr:transporter MATE [Anaerostipes sp. MSJ-23]